jgi:hypothetical protein
VDPEGRQSEAGATEGLTSDNVVRLPRDWLGPRDELIPFGPSADGAADSASTPTADDFWGEDSSSIQTALEAPAFVNPAWGAASRARAREGFHTRARAVWLLGGVAAALLVTLAVVGGGSSPKHASQGLLATRTARSIKGSNLAGLTRTIRILEPPLSRHGRTPSEAVSRQHASSASAHRGRHRASGAAKPTGTVERVRYTRSARSATGESSAAASTAPPSTAPAPVAEPSGQASSSTNQPALGANGALGPGSSPDG